MLKVSIYIETDGSDARKRYRTYAAIVEFITKREEAVTREVCGVESMTLNGIMLTALAASLRILTKPCEITIYMDCDYVSENICSGKVYEWFANGWKTLQGKPTANCEEWKEVMGLLKRHEPVFTKKAHPYRNYLQDKIRKMKSRGMEYRQQAIGGDAV